MMNMAPINLLYRRILHNYCIEITQQDLIITIMYKDYRDDKSIHCGYYRISHKQRRIEFY